MSALDPELEAYRQARGWATTNPGILRAAWLKDTGQHRGEWSQALVDGDLGEAAGESLEENLQSSRARSDARRANPSDGRTLAQMRAAGWAGRDWDTETGEWDWDAGQ